MSLNHVISSCVFNCWLQYRNSARWVSNISTTDIQKLWHVKNSYVSINYQRQRDSARKEVNLNSKFVDKIEVMSFFRLGINGIGINGLLLSLTSRIMPMFFLERGQVCLLFLILHLMQIRCIQSVIYRCTLCGVIPGTLPWTQRVLQRCTQLHQVGTFRLTTLLQLYTLIIPIATLGNARCRGYPHMRHGNKLCQIALEVTHAPQHHQACSMGS